MPKGGLPLPTRRVLCAGACLAAVLVLPAVLGAQAKRVSRDDPPVTWCEKPGTSHIWERQDVYVTLDFAERDSSATQHALRPYLPFLLSGIAQGYMAEHQPTRDPAASRQAPPPGEPRYDPPDLLNPDIIFDLRGDGSIDSISVTDTLGSTLVADLKAALNAAMVRGDVFGPYAAPETRTRLRLSAQLHWPWDTVHWPAFTINAPIEKPPLAKPGNRTPNYPSDARDWEGALLFQYKVDAEGRAVRGTARVLKARSLKWTPDMRDPRWSEVPSAGSHEAFAAFKREVEAVLPSMRFLAPEYLGCRVEEWVQQEFQFQLERRP